MNKTQYPPSKYLPFTGRSLQILTWKCQISTMSRINTWKKYRKLCETPPFSWSLGRWLPHLSPLYSALPHICPLPSGFLLWPSDHFCPSLAALGPSSLSTWLSAYSSAGLFCGVAGEPPLWNSLVPLWPALISAVVHLKQLDEGSIFLTEGSEACGPQSSTEVQPFMLVESNKGTGCWCSQQCE